MVETAGISAMSEEAATRDFCFGGLGGRWEDLQRIDLMEGGELV